MWYLVAALSGFGAGLSVGLTIVWCLRNNLVRRLAAVRAMAETQRDLENRRVAYDSGREHLVRANAGRPARITDGLGTKPGTLAKYLGNK